MATAVIREGLLERLKESSGLKTDDAFANAIGVSRATLNRVRAGEEPSTKFIVGIALAFGLGLGEVAYAVEDVPLETRKTA